MKFFTLKDLADAVDGQIVGDDDIAINKLTSLDLANDGQLSYIEDPKYISAAKESNAVALMVSEQIGDIDKPQLVVKNIDAAVITILNMFAPKLSIPKPGVHRSAIVEESAKVDASSSIGPNVYIGENVVIGKNCIIGSGVSIDQDSIIGDNTRLYSNVTIYDGCKIGKNCIIQSGSVIGGIGFGYSYIEGEHKLIPHNCGVTVEDNVHVGANCCVDRGKFLDTMIGAGTRMDNMIQVGHGAQIGKCCLIVSHVALAGSVKIGNGVVLAGQVGVANMAKIGDGAKVGAKSGVISDLGPGKDYLGAPAIEVREQLKIMMATPKLPELIKKVKKLNKRIESLESAADDS